MKELFEITINTDNLGAPWMYDEQTDKFDLIGAICYRLGVPKEIMAGYAAPADCVIGILIYGAEPGAKDNHVSILNMFMKQDSTFSNSAATNFVNMAYDAAREAGALSSKAIQDELVAACRGVGFDVHFTQKEASSDDPRSSHPQEFTSVTAASSS